MFQSCRGIRLTGDPALLVETVRSVAIVETVEPITSIGRLEEDDLDDMDISDLSNQQIKEVSRQHHHHHHEPCTSYFLCQPTCLHISIHKPCSCPQSCRCLKLNCLTCHWCIVRQARL